MAMNKQIKLADFFPVYYSLVQQAVEKTLWKSCSSPIFPYLWCVHAYFNSYLYFTIRDAPDIRPDNQPFLISGIRLDTRLPCRISGRAG
jgi:hypothetical protein